MMMMMMMMMMFFIVIVQHFDDVNGYKWGNETDEQTEVRAFNLRSLLMGTLVLVLKVQTKNIYNTFLVIKHVLAPSKVRMHGTLCARFLPLWQYLKTFKYLPCLCQQQ